MKTVAEARIYASLTKERPEGQIVLDEREKADLEKWLGVWMWITPKISCDEFLHFTWRGSALGSDSFNCSPACGAIGFSAPQLGE